MREHVCELAEPICVCNVLADEPSEKCTIHGGAPEILRCKHCGKFMKRKQAPQTEFIDSTSCIDVDYDEDDLGLIEPPPNCCKPTWKLFFYDPSMYMLLFLIVILILVVSEKIKL